MPYSIQFGDNVKPYLSTRLTRTGIVKVYSSLDTALRENGDYFINNPARPISDSPLRFWYHLVIIDPPQSKTVRPFWFVVNAEKAKYGILQVEYVQEDEP